MLRWAGPKHFFTDGGSKRVCKGDSGGPALERNAPYVMGIASRAELDGACTESGGRQRYYKVRRETADFVNHFLDWWVPNTPRCRVVDSISNRWWCSW